jgi:hypothetical protein
MAYLTDSSRELALDMISQANARNQPRPRGTTLSAWDKSTALRRWCGDLFPMPAGPELDGVTLTAPFLDRRVTESALAALDFETRAGSTRQLLASTVESVTGRPFHGRHAHYTDLLERMLRHGLSTNARLFDAAILVELGIVDAKRVKAFVDGFRAGRAAALGPLWRLVSAEAWARIF